MTSNRPWASEPSPVTPTAPVSPANASAPSAGIAPQVPPSLGRGGCVFLGYLGCFEGFPGDSRVLRSCLGSLQGMGTLGVAFGVPTGHGDIWVLCRGCYGAPGCPGPSWGSLWGTGTSGSSVGTLGAFAGSLHDTGTPESSLGWDMGGPFCGPWGTRAPHSSPWWPLGDKATSFLPMVGPGG